MIPDSPAALERRPCKPRASGDDPDLLHEQIEWLR